MNVFIFHIGTPTPVFEIELELIRKHELLGDKIRVFQCTGNLTNCHWNPLHWESKCGVCRSKFKNGWSILNAGGNVQLEEFPVNKLHSIDFPLRYDSVDDIKKFKFDGESLGYGIVSDLTSRLREHRFDVVKYFKEINLGLRTSVEVYVTLKKEFIENKPDRVYFFNGRIATHLPAKLLCKKMNIEYFAYEIGVQDGTYRSTKNVATHDPISLDEIELARLNWTLDDRKIAEDFFNQKRNGNDVLNLVSYVKNQKKGLIPVNFNSAKINIAIFNSSLDEYSGIEEWKNKIYEPDETSGIRDILESFIEDSRYMFYLRVHPNLSTVSSNSSQLADIHELSKEYKNLYVIWPGDIVDSYALIDACDKVITFGSTIGIEATYWGKPSILGGRAFYENFDCVYKPKSHEELVDLLKKDIGPLPRDEALLFPYVYIESTKVNTALSYKWFSQTGIKNGLPAGTFDGVEIKSDLLPAMWYEVHNFFGRALRAIVKPSEVLSKMKIYFKVKK